MSAPEASLRGAESGSGRADVVVVAYETPELLDACLRSLQDAGRSIDAVVVVDNSRSSRCAEVVATHPHVRLIKPATNGGYGAGANAGVQSCSSGVVVILNADVRVDAHAVAAMSDALQQHPRAAVAGPRLVGFDGVAQPSCARFPTALGVFVHESGLWKLARRTKLGHSLAPFFEPERDAVVPWLLGAALAVRRDVFQAAGGFDESFFMYYEEVDLCRRLADLGWSTLYVPHAVVEHAGGASTSREPEVMQRAMYRSLARYASLHWRDPKLLRLRGAVAATAIARTLTDAVRGRGASARAHLTVLREAARGWPAAQGVT